MIKGSFGAIEMILEKLEFRALLSLTDDLK